MNKEKSSLLAEFAKKSLQRLEAKKKAALSDAARSEPGYGY